MALLMAAALLATQGTVVALTVNETPKVKFADAWGAAAKIGIRATTLPVDWSRIEPKPGEYELAWPRVADSFYPVAGAELGIVFRDLNTNRDERPADLKSKAFDDPVVAERWRKMADAVLDAMPKAKLSWIAVGNEADVFLSGDKAKIEAYTRHLRAAFAHLRKKRPGVRLGTCLTLDGVRKHGSTLRPILDAGDVAMVNYYLMDGARRPPQTQVPKDLDAMASFASDKPLLLTEAGAPSGTVVGSSEAAQAEFVRTILSEARRRKLPYVNFVWMNDIGDGAVNTTAGYYGFQDATFKDFLGTLGLRNSDGNPKPAWKALEGAIPL